MGKSIFDQIKDMGYQAIEGQTILVKKFSENLSQQVIDFVLSDYYVLQVCEGEILLFEMSKWGTGVKAEVYRSLKFEDVLNVSVENYLMNYKITIENKEDTLVLSTQQKELSGFRFSGLISIGTEPGSKNWHADNLDRTLEALKAIV